MKTPIQELKEYFNQQLRLKISGEIECTSDEVLIDAIQLCENCIKTKEKEHIKKAWIHGDVRSPLKLKHINNAENYYKETYIDNA